jgi:hypothetical protein
MEFKQIGAQHGAAVRWMAGFAVNVTIALGKDIALNARRAGNYALGFAQGLVRPNA